MMRRTRLNLSALRRGCIVGAGAAAGGRTFSRREMLGLTGGAVVGTSPALKALEAPFHGPFELVGDRSRVAFVLGGREHWVVDTCRFAGSPSLTVERSERLIRVELKGARYPGTNLPADLRCELRQGATGWRMRLQMALGGFTAEVPLERWLAGREVARSRVHLKGKDLPLGKGSHLKLQGPARAEFSPSWELRLSGSDIAQLSGLGESIVSDSAILSLLAPDAPSILRSPMARRSMIRLERGQRDWKFEVGQRSGGGWKLVTEGSSFDLIEIELGVTRLGLPRRALLATAGVGATEPRIFFQPAALNSGTVKYSGPGGKPFSLPLYNARYAVAFDASGDETALLARYGHQVWMRAEGCTLQLGDHSEIEPFELRGQHLHCAPALLSVAAPLAGAVVEPAAAPDGARLAFVSDKPVRAHPRSFSRLHLEGAGAGISRLNVTAFSASVLRPEDLLYLRFTSQNLNLQSGAGQQPKIVVADTTKPGYLIVTFQPQAIVEEAYFETADGYPVPSGDPDASTGIEPPKTPPIPNLMAGTSRLVFVVPKDSPPIPYTLESLLSWNQWGLSVSPLAVQPGAHPPRTPGSSDLHPYPNAQPPADNQTAIEAPWRLIISPPDQLSGPGATLAHDLAGQSLTTNIVGARNLPAWAHATNAVSHLNKATNTTATELWHTRYAVRTSSGAVDETAGEDLLTLRAIWTPDYYHDTHYDPFRTALSSDDRHDLVDLTTHFNPYVDLGTGVVTRYNPVPVGVNRLMLSALGAWLNLHGAWNPPEHIISLEEWRHQATMGRDHYVRVVYKGYLFPFGHRASLIKITERKFRQTDNGRVAYLFQREFIVVRQPVKTYNPGDYPSDWDEKHTPADYPANWRDSYAGRNMPFKSVRIATLVTPNLDDPAQSTISVKQPDTGKTAKPDAVFWPYVGGAPFLFHLVGTDVTNQQIEFTAPLIFIKDEHSVATDESQMKTVQSAYLDDDSDGGKDGEGPSDADALSRRQRDFAGQKVAYFDPRAVHIPADEPPDAPPPMAPNLETFTMTFNAAVPPASVSLPSDQPRFYPIVDEAAVLVPAVKRLIGQDSPARIQFNQGVYLPSGLDAAANPGQVFADVNPPIRMVFGASSTPDAPTTPGPVSPNMVITGLSVTTGPIGGDTTKFAKGTLDWSEFFGDPSKLLSDEETPKLFGFLSLHSVLGDTSTGRAPKVVAPPTLLLGGASIDQTVYKMPPQNLVDVKPPLLPYFLGHTGTKNDPDSLLRPKDRVQGQITITLINKQPVALSGSGGHAPDPATLDIFTELTNFTIDLWGQITAQFNKLSFSVDSNKKPSLGDTDLKSIHFGGVLALVQTISDFVENTFGGGGGGSGGSGGSGGGSSGGGGLGFEVKPFVKPYTPPGDGIPTYLDMGISITIAHIPAGVFNLSSVSLTSHLLIPILPLENHLSPVPLPTKGDHPLRMRFELSSRERPFFLSVLLFGGGGSFAIEIAPGSDTIEGQLEFGAVYAVDLGVAFGMAAVVAGIYFHLEKQKCSLTGYVRMGGSLSVIKLITASLEFYLGLTYDDANNVAYGQATLSVEVSIPFFSVSVDVTYEQKFAGSGSVPHAAAYALEDMTEVAPRPAAASGPPPISAVLAESDWTEYCAAFA